MFMFGSFVTSGALPAAGSAMSAPVAGAVLGVALLVLFLILIGIADDGGKPKRRAREPKRLAHGSWKPLGHGRST